MFKKILVANRGEIALRVIFACRELGIKTVAVYSEADENSLHVRFADEDICIGPARSADSYLNVPAIISAAEITGADAIHPGYGFLSESAYLAEVCEACHIRFIGPDPTVIRLLGDKAKARRAMKKAGVPMLPGSDGPIESEEKALKVAKDIGYPVIIKAVAGGGGRGMRIVQGAGRPAARVQDRAARGGGGVRRRRRLHREVSRRRRATSSSRCSAIITATSIHLGERECSIQRRHQKLLEESPSVAVSDKVRRKMGERGRRRGARGAVHQRRHLRVPDGREGQLLLHGSEHAHPGRASGHRDGDRHRHRQGADSHRRRRAAVVQAERGDLHRPRDRVPDQRRGSRDVRALAGRRSTRSASRAGRACASTRRRTPSARSRRTTIR